MAVQIRHVTESRTGQWWVVNTSPPSGSPTIYTVLEGTQDEALNLPNGGGISGPYSTLAQANQVASTEPENKTQPTPIPGVGITPGGSFTGSGPLAGLAAIGDFFQRLSQGSTWIRVGEVAIGVILVGIGLNAMLKGKPLQVVTGTVGKVGRVVA